MRESDESLPPDLHHWLSKVDQEVGGLRVGLNDLIRDVNSVRVDQAELKGSAGRPTYALLAIFLTIGVQTAYGMYWGGQLSGRVEASIAEAQKSLRILEDHLRGAGEHRANVARYGVEIQRLAECCSEIPLCQERINKLEERMQAQEKRAMQRDAWWERVWASGVIKGSR